jgi:hypothetical protein
VFMKTTTNALSTVMMRSVPHSLYYTRDDLLEPPKEIFIMSILEIAIPIKLYEVHTEQWGASSQKLNKGIAQGN